MGIRKRRIILSCFLFSLLFVFAAALFPGEPSHLSVSQAAAEPPEVIAYISVLDGDGIPVTGLAKTQFTATLGEHPAEVAELLPFSDANEGTAYIVLVDISRTLTETEFKQIRASLVLWIDKMKPADRMAILTFGDTCTEAADFTADQNQLKTVVGNLAPTAPKTQLYKALKQGMQMAQRRDKDLPHRRVIAVLSDGKDEGSGLYESDVKQDIEKFHVPVYSIGYSRLKGTEKEKYLKILNNFSTISGGVYTEASENDLENMYQTIRQSILSVYRLRLRCEDCPRDGRLHRLQLNFAAGTRRFSDGIDIRLMPEAPEPQPVPPGQDRRQDGQPGDSTGQSTGETAAKKDIPIWMIAGGGGLLLIAILILILVKKKKPRPFASSPGESFEPGAEPAVPPTQMETGAGEENGTVNGKENEAETTVDLGRQGTGELTVAELDLPLHPTPTGTKIKLVEVGGIDRNTELHLVLQDTLIVGRKQGCDAVIEGDLDISREHFRLIARNGGVMIEDLGTTNGTKVNGVLITGAFRLENGDRIVAGRTELRIIFK